MTRIVILTTVAASVLLAAGAAEAAGEPGRPTRLDDGSCYAKALEAQYVADRRADGDIPLKWGMMPEEKIYLNDCGGPLPGVEGHPQPPAGYVYSYVPGPDLSAPTCCYYTAARVTNYVPPAPPPAAFGPQPPPSPSLLLPNPKAMSTPQNQAAPAPPPPPPPKP
jgi:hypothetical protein